MTTEYEAHRYADIFPMIGDEEFTELKKDIKTHGLLTPVILHDGKILDGRNRYKACKELGIEPTLDIYSGEAPLQYVISLNLKRRHLTKQQAACAAVRNEELITELEAEAKARHARLSGTRANPGEVVEKIPQPGQKKTREVLAETFHTNDRYIQDAKKLKEESPEIFKKIETGETTFQEYKSEKKKEDRLHKIEEQRKAIAEQAPQLPQGKYEVIVIDPPWKYHDDKVYDAEGFRGTTDYPTMTIEEIKNIELPHTDDCVLWLWTTHKFMRHSFELLDKWGFEEKAILTWCKNKMGIGRWLRSKSEFCIMAVKGKPLVQLTNQTTVLEAPATGHSEKPQEFYDMVDDLCIGRKLDYFARKNRTGWDVFGDEV